MRVVYPERLHRAIEFAVRVHHVDQDQRRKGKKTPYITHLLSVVFILSRVSENEDLWIAGVLHDVVEDGYPPGSVTLEQVRAEFGDRVASLVEAVTEKPEWQDLPWRERKQRAMSKLEQMSQEALLLKSADVLHNLASTVDDWQREGKKIFERFNSNLGDQLWRYEEMVAGLERVWDDNPLLEDLESRLAEFRRLAGLSSEMEE